MTAWALLCGVLLSSQNKANRGEQEDKTSCRVFAKTREQHLLVAFVRVVSLPLLDARRSLGCRGIRFLHSPSLGVGSPLNRWRLLRA